MQSPNELGALRGSILPSVGGKTHCHTTKRQPKFSERLNRVKHERRLFKPGIFHISGRSAESFEVAFAASIPRPAVPRQELCSRTPAGAARQCYNRPACRAAATGVTRPTAIFSTLHLQLTQNGCTSIRGHFDFLRSGRN